MEHLFFSPPRSHFLFAARCLRKHPGHKQTLGQARLRTHLVNVKTLRHGSPPQQLQKLFHPLICMNIL